MRCFLFLFGIVLLFSAAAAQDKGKVKPLPPGSSVEEIEKWTIGAIDRSASYKSDRASASVSDIKFASCELSFTVEKHFDSSAYATMGTTRSSTSVKAAFSVDLKGVSPEGIYLLPSLSPELATLVFSSAKYSPPDTALGVLASSDPGKITEIEIRRAESITLKDGLIQAVRSCRGSR